MRDKILIIGSSNTDMVIKTKTFPQPGETILGGQFLMNAGGKGANQAVAAARLGGSVRFVTKTGNDVFGRQALEGYLKEKIDISFSTVSDQSPSGIALITVNESGENTIAVASGANMELLEEDLPDSVFDDISYALIQLEIPMSTVGYIAKKCREKNIPLILNPAPAASIRTTILKDLYLITPNETETATITGINPDSNEHMKAAAAKFTDLGVKNIIITLGKNGLYLKNSDYDEIIPAEIVKAVDSTAAGDVFSGALVTALATGMELRAACQHASHAAAISVTRPGAQASAPYAHEL